MRKDPVFPMIDICICEICHAPNPRGSAMCPSCDRSYDRSAHREGTVYEAMLWAANRACRLRGSTRVRHRGLVTIVFDEDELLSKIECARERLAQDRK